MGDVNLLEKRSDYIDNLFGSSESLTTPTESLTTPIESVTTPTESLTPIESNKKGDKRHITMKQKDLIVNYVIENPEMVTHSSTKENERELWKDLQMKLNDLKPEKSLDNWKNFWVRWRTNLFSKPESSLTTVDCKLKQFLQKIMNNVEDNNKNGIVNRKTRVKKVLTIDEINNRIAQIEEEKFKLNLEIDNNDFRIAKFHNSIKLLENENDLKRKRIKCITQTKFYLNYKKRKSEIIQNNNIVQTEESEEIENQVFQEQI